MPGTKKRKAHPKAGSKSEEPQAKKQEKREKLEKKLEAQPDVSEFGHVLFLYRPKVTLPEGQDVESVDDVQRLGMLMHPEIIEESQSKKKSSYWRMVMFGKKQLPSLDKHEVFWAHVNKIFQDEEEDQMKKDLFEQKSYETKTRGTRTPQPMRVAGMGSYALIDHDGHTHFVYELEVPQKVGEVQKQMRISNIGNYIISIKNPKRRPPDRNLGLSKKQAADYPKDLREDLGSKAFGGDKPREFLDHEGSEMIFIGAKKDVERELGEPFSDLAAQTEAEVECEELDDKSAAFEKIRDMVNLRKKEANIALTPAFGDFI